MDIDIKLDDVIEELKFCNFDIQRRYQEERPRCWEVQFAKNSAIIKWLEEYKMLKENMEDDRK